MSGNKVYLSKNDDEENKKRIAIKKLFPEILDSGNLEYVKVSFEIGYWRKSNHIHKWFVDNVQNETDDCGHYEVSREDLKELLDVCKEVLKDKTSNLLPTQEGFFFGGVAKEKWYYDDLKRTIKIIERCLELPTLYDFEYHSSW